MPSAIITPPLVVKYELLLCFILALPLSPSTPLASEISTNTLTLTWLAPEFNGGIVLKDYELQMKNETGNVFVTIMFTTQLRVQIRNLLAGMKYSFRVAARNELGRGRWSGDTLWIPMKILGMYQELYARNISFFVVICYFYHFLGITGKLFASMRLDVIFQTLQFLFEFLILHCFIMLKLSKPLLRPFQLNFIVPIIFNFNKFSIFLQHLQELLPIYTQS